MTSILISLDTEVSIPLYMMKNDEKNNSNDNNRHDWMGKGIHPELCKKSDYTKKNVIYIQPRICPRE